MFEFDSNVFRMFKDHFFRVMATDIVAGEFPLMHDQNGEPYFSFYWQLSPTRFKSFDECQMSLEERVDKSILEQFPTLLDAGAIPSLLSVGDPRTILDGKAFYLPLFRVCFCMTLSKSLCFHLFCRYNG